MILKRLNSSLFKSLSYLVTGSVLAQIVTLLASPILTRLYTPEMIGEYTLLLTAVGLFGSVICGRYDVAIVAEEKEECVLPLMALSVLISVLLGGFISIFFAIYYYLNDYTIQQILFNAISIYLLLLFTGITNALFSYNNRNREYKLLSGIGFIRALIKEITMLLGGLWNPGTWILICSHILGIISGVNYQSRSLKASVKREQLKVQISLATMKQVAIKHKKQPLFSMPALFVNNFSYSAINLFLKSLFGSAVLGFYSISYRLLGLPLGIISTNLSSVYLEEASRKYDCDKDYSSLFKKVSLFLLCVSIPLTVLIILLAPMLCSFFFGKAYHIAGVYAQYLAPMFGIRFIVAPLTVGTLISRKQNVDFCFQLCFFICAIIIFLAAKELALSMITYLSVISTVYSILYITYYIYLYSLSKCNE